VVLQVIDIHRNGLNQEKPSLENRAQSVPAAITSESASIFNSQEASALLQANACSISSGTRNASQPTEKPSEPYSNPKTKPEPTAPPLTLAEASEYNALYSRISPSSLSAPISVSPSVKANAGSIAPSTKVVASDSASKPLDPEPLVSKKPGRIAPTQGKESAEKLVQPRVPPLNRSLNFPHTVDLEKIPAMSCFDTLYGGAYGVSFLNPLGYGQLLSGNFAELELWDLSTRRSINCLKQPDSFTTFSSVALLENSLVAIGYRLSFDIEILDLSTRECFIFNTLKGHEQSISALASLPGGLLVSGDLKGTIKLWDRFRGECLNTFNGHTFIVHKFVLLPGNVLASASADGTIRVWDLSAGWLKKLWNGDCLNTIRISDNGMDTSTDIASLDGNLLISRDKKIWLWNPTTGKCLKTIHHDYPIKKIVPLSGGRFATADNDITIWDIATGNRLNILPESRDAHALAPLDGNLLVSGHKKGSIKLWKL